MRLAAVVLAVLALDLAAGDRLFRAGDYAGAIREYEAALREDPGSAVTRYNLGTALLRAGRYDEAREQLAYVARRDLPSLRPAAYYNLGNTDLEPAFRGREAGEGNEERLRRAIVGYKRALLLDPDDLDAKWNLELARRLLERPDRPQGGGGGGEGGGGGDDPRRGENDPSPQGADPRGPRPDVSRAEAERMLGAAEARELTVQRRELSKDQPPSPGSH